MSAPTTAEQAARLLGELADGMRLPNAPAQKGDTPWQTITRRLPVEHGARYADAQLAALRHETERTSVQLDLPPVLWGTPYAAGVSRFLANRGVRRQSLTPRPVQSARRARLSVLGDVSGLPATPEASWALTATALAATQTAQELRTWAQRLPVRQAAAARDEARAYDQHAAAAQEQLPTSFAWVSDVPPAPPEKAGSSWT